MKLYRVVVDDPDMTRAHLSLVRAPSVDAACLVAARRAIVTDPNGGGRHIFPFEFESPVAMEVIRTGDFSLPLSMRLAQANDTNLVSIIAEGHYTSAVKVVE